MTATELRLGDLARFISVKPGSREDDKIVLIVGEDGNTRGEKILRVSSSGKILRKSAARLTQI